MTSTPVLEGYGVRLTPLAMEHLPALDCTHDDRTWSWMFESGSTPEKMRALVERALAATAAGTTQAWTTTLMRESGPPLVSGCSRIADIDPQHRRGEIGWTWVAPAFRGSGLNVRVKCLQLTHAFHTLGLRRVAFRTHHSNLRSQRAMLKLGARFEGTHRNHMIMPDGSSRDTLWYSIIDTDWPEVQKELLQRIAGEPLQVIAGSLLSLPAGSLMPLPAEPLQ